MKKAKAAAALDRSALRLLGDLANNDASRDRASISVQAGILIASDLAKPVRGGLQITDAGRAYLMRHAAGGARADVAGSFRAQHGHLAICSLAERGAHSSVLFDESESPLTWLARRKARDGRALIEPHQFLAGERLRADFTRGQVMPRTTSNWESPVARGQRAGGGPVSFSDAALAARQRLQNALGAVGPEFSGLLLDVCCFLKRLEDVERERLWPARSAKVVLQLALERLARHYGFAAQARGKASGAITVWRAEGEVGLPED